MDKGRYQFSEPFRSQLERALRGYSPSRQEVFRQRAMKGKPPSQKQIEWLTQLHLPVPATMKEASLMLDQEFGKKA